MTVGKPHSGREHSTSGFFHSVFDGVFHVAFDLLCFAFLLLNCTFDLQFFVTGDLADALLDVTNGFVGHAFDLVCPVPRNLDWRFTQSILYKLQCEPEG